MTLMDFLKKGSKDGQSIPARIILYAEKRREEMMIATEANCPVANGKYREGYFSDELVQASYNVLHDLILEQNITWITYIDSLRRL